MLGPVVLALAFGFAVGTSNSIRTGDVGNLGGPVGGALVQLPAVWVVVGVVVAAYGLAPRLVPVGWGVLVAFLLLGELGPLLELPSWAMDISPFSHILRLPGGEMRWVPLLWLTGMAAALLALGLAGFRRRDIAER